MWNLLTAYIFLNIINTKEIAAQKTFISRIIGGTEATKNFAPYMVALVMGGKVKSMVCGGSIVSQSHILTAAHCIDAVTDQGIILRTFYGMVGSNQWKSTKSTIKFKQYINHPDWDINIIKNDIGILVSHSKLELNERVQFISLSYEWIERGIDSFVTGWGVTGPKEVDDVLTLSPTPENLQILYTKTLSAQQCLTRMRNLPEYLKPLAPEVDPLIELCTFHSAGHNVCNGDSGSPLVLSKSNEQIGIVSWGYCSEEVPDVFVRLSAFESFVTSIISSV